MPRTARKKSESGIYHVMLRGNERRDIFLDDYDKWRFLDRVKRAKDKGSCDIYAYCLMNNHVHLLIREAGEALDVVMKRLCVSYVYYFNKKYQRVGHLFQDRYRSEPIEDDPYLMTVAKYIHNNPVKAGLCASAEDFKWSSYEEYLNSRLCRIQVIKKEFLLSMFSDNELRAVELFKAFTRGQDEHQPPNFFEHLIDKQETANTEYDFDYQDKIEKTLANYGFSIESFRECKDKILRKDILREIKKTTVISIRELAGIIGINKDVIARIR